MLNLCIIILLKSAISTESLWHRAERYVPPPNFSNPITRNTSGSSSSHESSRRSLTDFDPSLNSSCSLAVYIPLKTKGQTLLQSFGYKLL